MSQTRSLNEKQFRSRYALSFGYGIDSDWTKILVFCFRFKFRFRFVTKPPLGNWIEASTKESLLRRRQAKSVNGHNLPLHIYERSQIRATRRPQGSNIKIFFSLPSIIVFCLREIPPVYFSIFMKNKIGIISASFTSNGHSQTTKYTIFK
jgi:hypothetical protein